MENEKWVYQTVQEPTWKRHIKKAGICLAVDSASSKGKPQEEKLYV